MDTLKTARLTLRPSADRRTLDGAWWPRSRELGAELVTLFAVWPVEEGYISRVIVSPGDWASVPDGVSIPLRRGTVKIQRLPQDTTHHVVLTMLDGQRRSLVVIPPGAARETAAKYLGAFGARRVAAPRRSASSLAAT